MPQVRSLTPASDGAASSSRPEAAEDAQLAHHHHRHDEERCSGRAPRLRRAALVDSSHGLAGHSNDFATVVWSRWSPKEALGSGMAVVRAHVGDVVTPLATQLAAVLAQALRQELPLDATPATRLSCSMCPSEPRFGRQ